MKRISQVFKKLFHKKGPSKVYICDLNRNTECGKCGCWYLHQGPCKCTTVKAYAMRDTDGKPVIASDNDMYNLDYWDEEIKKLNLKH